MCALHEMIPESNCEERDRGMVQIRESSDFGTCRVAFKVRDAIRAKFPAP